MCVDPVLGWIRLLRQALVAAAVAGAPWLFGAAEPWAVRLVVAPCAISLALAPVERLLRRPRGDDPIPPRVTPLPWLLKLPVLLLLLLPLLQALNPSHYVSAHTGAVYPIPCYGFLPSTAHRAATLEAWVRLAAAGMLLLAIPSLFTWPAARRARTRPQTQADPAGAHRASRAGRAARTPRRDLLRQPPGISRTALLHLLVVNALALALFAAVQRFSGTSLIYWTRDVFFRSFYGPFINENHAAQYLNLLIPVALGLALSKSDPTRRVGSTSQSFWFLAAILITVGSFFSLSRGGIVFGLLGILLFWLTLAMRAGRRARSLSMLAAALLVIAAYLQILGPKRILEELGTIRGDVERYEANTRWKSYQTTAQMIRDYPWFGCGFGSWDHLFPYYQDVDLVGMWETAHSDPLQFLAETGTTGGLLLVWIGIGLVAAWRRELPYRARPVARGVLAGTVALLANGLVDFPLRILAITTLWCALLAPVRREPLAEREVGK